MSDPTAKVLAGNVGFFWPQPTQSADLDDAQILRGYIHQAEDSMVEVRALDESDDFLESGSESSEKPALALFGAAEQTGLLIPDLLTRGYSTQFGSSRASVLLYRARTLITGVALDEVRSHRITEASLRFADGLTFAGLAALEEEFTTDPTTHVLTEARFTLKSSEDRMNGGKYGAFEIGLEPDWSTSGKGSTRTLNTGLSVGLSVSRPRPFAHFRAMLIGIQDLLNLAYDRFIAAESGRARVDGSEMAPRSYLWLHDTMLPPPHTQLIRSRHEESPLFTLADLGGSAGLRRWLKLRDEFPDAAQVVASGHRDGSSRQPARLLEVAAAIEFYVNANRRAGAHWASKSAAPSQTEALARRVGGPFEALTGDHSQWARKFRETYNSVKHDPSYARDPGELHVLAWSGQVLLLSALLDRAARSKAPSRRILADYRLRGGSEGLRKLLQT